MLRFLALLAIVFILSSCNTDELEPVASLCTEGTINVVHMQMDTIQDYTLADEFEKGVYPITSDEEFAAFFNEAPPAINYDSLTLLVAVVDAGDCTFTESIQTSYDCEGQKLNLNLSLYNYDENIDTLKYWRHVLVDSRFVEEEGITFTITPVTCGGIQSLEFTELYPDSVILFIPDSIPFKEGNLGVSVVANCFNSNYFGLSGIINNYSQLQAFQSHFNRAFCFDIDFSIFHMERGSVIIATFSSDTGFHKIENVYYNCYQKEIIIEQYEEGLGNGITPPTTLIIPIQEFLSNELYVKVDN